METHTLDIVLTFVVLSFWILFPIGMFLSVSHIERLEDLRREISPRKKVRVSHSPGLIAH